MYIKKVVLRDFQSHVHSVFTLDPHLNIFIGVSNVGKSSISRAISALLFGMWDKSWIRQGTDYAHIGIETNDGISVIKQKGEKRNRYILTFPNCASQTFDSFGIGVPQEVQQALKIHEIAIDKTETVNLNQSLQMDRLFMLGSSQAQNAKLLGKLSGAHYLDFAIKEINGDKRNFSQEKASKEKELSELISQIELLQPIELLSTRIQEIEAKLASVQALESRLERLQGLFQRVSAWKEAWTRETQKESILGLFSIDKIEQLQQKLRNMETFRILSSKLLILNTEFIKLNKEKFCLSSVYSIDFSDKINKIKQLKEFGRKIDINKLNLSNLNRNAIKLEQDYTYNIETYNKLLKSNKICPFCNSNVGNLNVSS